MDKYSPKFIKEIQKLIASGDTKKAIKKLNNPKYIPKNPVIKKQLILLTAQWNLYQQDKLEDIKSDRALNKEINRINKSILYILEGNFSAFEQKLPKNYTTVQHKITIVFSTVLIMVAAFFLWDYFQGDIPAPALIYACELSIISTVKPKPFMVKIYGDLSGVISQEEQTWKMEKIFSYTADSLHFIWLRDGQNLEFIGKSSLENDTLKGNVIEEGKVIGIWKGKEVLQGDL